jgi:hypothetical protein
MARVVLENVTNIFDGNVSAVSDFSLDITYGGLRTGCGSNVQLICQTTIHRR